MTGEEGKIGRGIRRRRRRGGGDGQKVNVYGGAKVEY